VKVQIENNFPEKHMSFSLSRALTSLNIREVVFTLFQLRYESVLVLAVSKKYIDIFILDKIHEF